MTHFRIVPSISESIHSEMEHFRIVPFGNELFPHRFIRKWLISESYHPFSSQSIWKWAEIFVKIIFSGRSPKSKSWIWDLQISYKWVGIFARGRGILLSILSKSFPNDTFRGPESGKSPVSTYERMTYCLSAQNAQEDTNPFLLSKTSSNSEL